MFALHLKNTGALGVICDAPPAVLPVRKSYIHTTRISAESIWARRPIGVFALVSENGGITASEVKK
jgi:hypothetical protein